MEVLSSSHFSKRENWGSWSEESNSGSSEKWCNLPEDTQLVSDRVGTGNLIPIICLNAYIILPLRQQKINLSHRELGWLLMHTHSVNRLWTQGLVLCCTCKEALPLVETRHLWLLSHAGQHLSADLYLSLLHLEYMLNAAVSSHCSYHHPSPIHHHLLLELLQWPLSPFFHLTPI